MKDKEYTAEEAATICVVSLFMLFLRCAVIAAAVVVGLWTIHFAVKWHIAPPIPCETQIEKEQDQ